ncbi:biotin--[acetyl-CoA-carboxylase] ligase [Lacticaseibacillus porcinae]|uniref:biotin--[acetyl-CoA-carboxylase] ligase n=1 Tax=Lacticaseibacillus porcinae TaxID=1123687 RepID=UPI000F7959F1|nr:biotin--[acetyl-CoA-carboxylase] ligase [Lacticaseibacillus porcinae]
MFTTETLQQALPQSLQAVDVTCVQQTTSTNQVMAQQLLHAPHPQLLVAGEQTQGVGRRGKAFFSPAHTGIYFTYGGFQLDPVQLSLITPAAGVALQLAAFELFGVTTQIKWVNDVLIGDQKIAGILANRLENGSVLVGVGVNIAPARDAPDVPIDLPVGTLLDHVPTTDMRPALVASWLQHFDQLLHVPESIMPQFRKHAAWLGRSVIVQGLSHPLVGVVQGFADDGALLLATDHGIESLNSGSIRLR